LQLRGHILAPDGSFVRGVLELEPPGTGGGRNTAGRITAVHGERVSEAAARADATLPIILPGFIDTHVHGSGGADVMDAGAAITTIARLQARHGTTAFLATTMTAPPEDLKTAFAALAPACAERGAGAARVLGVHLEGPYISGDKRGAQPAFERTASLEEVRALAAIAPIRLVTLAPEVAENLALIPALVEAGMRVQIGHSAATYEQALQALRAGASGFTHLFNAMSPLQHRAPGVVGAALAHAAHAEVIPDLLHVHAGSIHAALRAIPGLFCVSDATAATGMPDGEYRLGRQRVRKCEGGVRLADGTLAGSTVTLHEGLRNLVAIGLTLAGASARVSALAAGYLGLADRGRIEAGAVADLVLLDAATLELREVWVEGERIEAAGRPGR
jgi:N-acetylglucosamine-6-phosphate deacetylase